MILISWRRHSTEMIPVLPNIVQIWIFCLSCYLPVRFQHSLQSSAVDPAKAGELSLIAERRQNCFYFVAKGCKSLTSATGVQSRFTDLLHKLIWRLDSLLPFAQLIDSCFWRRQALVRAVLLWRWHDHNIFNITRTRGILSSLVSACKRIYSTSRIYGKHVKQHLGSLLIEKNSSWLADWRLKRVHVWASNEWQMTPIMIDFDINWAAWASLYC